MSNVALYKLAGLKNNISITHIGNLNEVAGIWTRKMKALDDMVMNWNGLVAKSSKDTVRRPDLRGWTGTVSRWQKLIKLRRQGKA
jgi:hypothetical protein